MAEAIAEGGRAGSGATAGAGFNLPFKAPSTDNPPGLTPEPRFGAAWAARFNGAVNDIAKKWGPRRRASP
jgi:organic hydroperoxide reductase OsmC/OhrA